MWNGTKAKFKSSSLQRRGHYGDFCDPCSVVVVDKFGLNNHSV